MTLTDIQFSSVQLLSHVWLFVSPLTAACQASLSITNSWSLNSCSSSWWCYPTISCSVVHFSCLQSFPASGSFQMSQLFAWGGQSIGVSASKAVLPKEYSGLISFRIDWFDLLAVKGTFQNLLQPRSSEASILWRSVFIMVQPYYPYMTPGKTRA